MDIQNETSRRSFLSGLIAVAGASCVSVSAQTAASSSKLEIAGSATPNMEVGGLSAANQGILDLTKSPFAKLQNVPIRAVAFGEGFWTNRRGTNVDSSIPTLRKEMEEHGRMDNFRRLSGENHAPRLGRRPCDADVYKWIEAVAFVLQTQNQKDLQSYTKALIKSIQGAQEPGGYLNTYYVGEHVPERMTTESQEVGHEIYCIGHLLQAGIAYYRATGDPALLDVGRHFLDRFLIPHFGPEQGKKPIISGHPEVEMALVELYRTTGEKRYLELAGYILNGDARIPVSHEESDRMFCGVPFTTRTQLEGHAVRAMYACCGATDYYLETGDTAYLTALTSLWDDLTHRKMYLTGGVGSVIQGETFGDAYELPNSRAYAESCAAIGNMMWNWRLLHATGESRYADIMEDALYNGVNSGMSLDGTLYLYRNPLAYDPSSIDQNRNVRSPWYDTTCCPPNLERTFASLPGYFYSTAKDGIYVHFFHTSALDWHLEDGTAVTVSQKTGYPWDGDVHITVSPAQSATFTLFLRIPGWARGAKVSVEGKEVPQVEAGQYLPIHRTWKSGEQVTLRMPMVPQVIGANPRVFADNSKVAIQRGPVLYCMEEIDQLNDVTLGDLRVSLTNTFDSEYVPHLLGGVVRIRHAGRLEKIQASAPLYGPVTAQTFHNESASLTFIPYFAWGNRSKSSMQVWTTLARS
jgi:uncharacterized protein